MQKLVDKQEKEVRAAYAEVQLLRRELQIAMTQRNSIAEEAQAKDTEIQAAEKRHKLEMKIKDSNIRNLHASLQKQNDNVQVLSARAPPNPPLTKLQPQAEEVSARS